MSALQVPRALLERYAVAAPRYTSYPTAVDWKNNATAEEYDAAVSAAATRSNEPLALYVHIPFCQELCLYCGCNVHITRNNSRGPVYVQHLKEQIAHAAQRGLGARPLTQHHWGGGTPTWLPCELIEELCSAISAVFRPAPNAEVAIEVDPRVTTDAQLALLGRLGFNRLSLGVQDFDPQVQQAVKREQSYEETQRVIEVGRASGFRSVNIDLIYGLPHQTVAGFNDTVQRTITLRPERVALFHYAHVPWLKKHQRTIDQAAVPDIEAKFAIFSAAVEAFSAAGYVSIGLDHFALPDDELSVARDAGTLQRNFMGYSTRAGAELLPLGVSAIGEIDGAYWQNDADLFSWQRRVAENAGNAVVRGHRLSAEDKLRRALIMEIMCLGKLDFEVWSQRIGEPMAQRFATELKDLEPLAADGLVDIDARGLRLTALGQVFMRNVAVVFDVYHRQRTASGSAAQPFSRTL